MRLRVHEAPMLRPRFVIMSGPPAAGKTTSAPLLAQGLGMPLFFMDEIKERLADALGESSAAYADELGEAAIIHLVAIARELLAAATM